MQRYTYTRYFNSKYLRRGSLFLRPPFIIELEGLYHKLAALSYTLRNPVHHGVTSTPFEYRHSSARALFRDALGRDDCQDFLPEYLCHRYLPDHRSCPSGYKMGKNGLILRENVLDVSDVEHMFVTPRSFLYYMNRLSGEEWQREQEKDLLAGAPITLDVIESGIGYQSMSQMLAFEHGRADYRAMDDLALCEKIDNEILPVGGELYILLDRQDEPRCIIEILSVNIIPLDEVTWEMAKKEGEDFNLEQWKEKTLEYLNDGAAILGYEVVPNLKLVYQTFKVVYK